MQQQDFLFELGCEELPPKALMPLAQSLHESIKKSFESLSLNFVDSECFATPRRLAVRFNQLDLAQPDRQVERLGPAVSAAFNSEGSPTPAALGFAKSCGVEFDALTRKATDKGERLAFVAMEKGQATSQLLQDIIAKAIAQLPVPKAMRWGNFDHQFSRPVHWLLAIHGENIVPLNLFGLTASNQTYGHRFHAPQALSIGQPSDYESILMEAKVVVCFEARKAKIRIQVEQAAQLANGIAVIDESLLEEVTALVEWPVALVGNFDQDFLSVPAEALISSMAEHQKYFHLLDSSRRLLPKFVAVANIESKHPQSVIEGNEKVIRPRLADAKFFYDTDSKSKLEDYRDKLKTIVFQNQLGTLFDKTQRVKALAHRIATALAADSQLTDRAAELCKCDLMTNMVYEFTDLQGIMGRYYASNDGEPAEVAAAMDEIYMPRFAGDQLPQTTTGLILAIAERIDTLVGIFGIGQVPSGAKDPFALRRAALGVIRLIAEKQLKLDLAELIQWSLSTMQNLEISPDTEAQLLNFFQARTLAMYQEQGINTQVIQAVAELSVHQPYDFKQRVEAVAQFNLTAESADLAEANKRVKNILEKSATPADLSALDTRLFQAEEQALHQTIEQVSQQVSGLVATGEYAKALEQLAGLKDVVNAFFDKVMINVDDAKVRNNRLALISQLRNLFLGIADISLLQK